MKRLVALMICALLTLTGCVPAAAERHEKTAVIMGTVVTGTAYGGNGAEGLEQAFKRAAEIDAKLSISNPESEINRVNAGAYEAEIEVSGDLYECLRFALYWAEQTDGAFDPSLGKAIAMWGIGTEDARVPEPYELEPYIGLRGFEKIILDENERTVRFTDERVSLNLGAVAKGYAADEMAKALRDAGVESAVLSLGGNVLTLGTKPGGTNWRVDITDPENPGGVLEGRTLEVADMSIVTSGGYERFFVEDGVKYHHILDPAACVPASSGLLSATIICASSAKADALSTAVFVLGAERGAKLIGTLPEVGAIFVLDSGELIEVE